MQTRLLTLCEDKEWLYEKYYVEKLSSREIAKLAHVSKTKVLNSMKKLGIERRTNGEAYRLALTEGKIKLNTVSGKDHYMYGKSIPEEVKKKISKANSGKNNYKWKPKVSNNGYILIHCEGHPHATESIYEHRLVIEKHIGRYLTDKEIVHHINSDRADNRIENLHLFASQKDHAYFHRMEYFKKPVPLQYSYNH